MSAKPFELQPLQGGKVGLLAVFTATWEKAVEIARELGTYPSHSHDLIAANLAGLEYGVYLRKRENVDQFIYYISVVPLRPEYGDFKEGEVPLYGDLSGIKSRKGVVCLSVGRDLARKIREKGMTHE